MQFFRDVHEQLLRNGFLKLDILRFKTRKSIRILNVHKLLKKLRNTNIFWLDHHCI